MKGDSLVNVKAVPGLAPFQVNLATEATDEERRREEKSKKALAKSLTPPKAKAETEIPVSIENDSSISRQIVDSEKVIQLLAYQPTHKKIESKIFLKNLSKKPTLSSDSSKQKKVDRIL